MLKTVYPGSVLTLENFSHQGQVSDDLAARLSVPEHGGSRRSRWITPSPDLILMLACKLKNLTGGHELYQKLAHGRCLFPALLYDMSLPSWDPISYL